jgi:hypothetical protein
MKILTLLAACVSILQVIACKNQANRAEAKRPRFSQTQIDSFRNLSGQVIPKSLWGKISEESLPPQVAHFLAGNLDADPNDEVILWYSWETTGQAICLDKRGEVWENIGKIDLDFFHGATPPRIDTATRMLLTYVYGSGSGYGSEVLNFYQKDGDSLICVFRLLEREGLAWPGCDAFRSIDARYFFKDSSQILATFRYELRTTEYNSHPEKLVFQQKLSIPFVWDATQKRFAPILPEGFPPLEYTEGFLDYGEPSFDVFYEADLEKIKRHGPRWKQEALCNPALN